MHPMERTAKIKRISETDSVSWKGGGTMNCKDGMLRWLRDLLCGALIGAGAILPGVSGGELAVVFDIYRPFM